MIFNQIRIDLLLQILKENKVDIPYMSDNISQWHNSAGETISRCGSSTSATARLRGNNRYREAASNISSAWSIRIINIRYHSANVHEPQTIKKIYNT